jgi:ferrous iron transport protein B
MTIRVALLGNPNTGKTTVFNALTGHRARVGNYAGVTVERREGDVVDTNGEVILIDLPGTYSLAAQSPDEMVAVHALLGSLPGEPRPDVAVVVLDASNIERNLFLATQVMELGLPVILALNMVDLADAEGLKVDAGKLSAALGVRVVELVAREKRGLDALSAAIRGADHKPSPLIREAFPEVFHDEIASLRAQLATLKIDAKHIEPFLVQRALLDANGMAGKEVIAAGGDAAAKAIADARARLETAGLKLRSLEASGRYKWIRAAAKDFVTVGPKSENSPGARSDRADRILTHKVWGSLIFFVIMTITFQAIFSWAGPLMDLIDGAFGSLGEWVGGMMSEGALRSLVVDGIIAGVGGVVIFLPQILILFFFLSLLEDVGYMSRAAFLMDRLLSRVGLSGRSFIPMLSSFACAIPGVMATRTIDDPKDRLTTMLVAPLMSCSARIPVYVLLIKAFVPDQKVFGFFNLQGLVMLAMYLVGIVVAIPVALILKKTLLKGGAPVFLIELPPYRQPLWTNVAHRLWERGQAFLVRAGTLILASSILIWALSYYPRDPMLETQRETRLAEVSTEDEAAEVNAYIDGELLRTSFLGRMGHAIEPAVKPLGWDWRIGMSVIASFPAREVIVATLGVIFNQGADTDEESEGLREQLKDSTWPDGRPLFTLPVALGVMVFFALCMQCAATLATMKRETNSWRWPIFSFVYMTTLAYIGALVVYQVGSRL